MWLCTHADPPSSQHSNAQSSASSQLEGRLPLSLNSRISNPLSSSSSSRSWTLLFWVQVAALQARDRASFFLWMLRRAWVRQSGMGGGGGSGTGECRRGRGQGRCKGGERGGGLVGTFTSAIALFSESMVL